MSFEQGELIVYTSSDGQASIDVRLKDETVWLSQAQMQELFGRDQSVISRHVNNVFKEGELPRERNMQKVHIANSDKPATLYNLDVIISVGYRIKSKRGILFRIWAISVLKDHLVKGYTLNQKRLAEKGIDEVTRMLELLGKTLKANDLHNDKGRGRCLRLSAAIAVAGSSFSSMMKIRCPCRRAEANPLVFWSWRRHGRQSAGCVICSSKRARQPISWVRNGEAVWLGFWELFSRHSADRSLYPSVEEKAAHMLYFLIKDHPFVDGNKERERNKMGKLFRVRS